jgi:hypothetical protein
MGGIDTYTANKNEKGLFGYILFLFYFTLSFIYLEKLFRRSSHFLERKVVTRPNYGLNCGGPTVTGCLHQPAQSGCCRVKLFRPG